MDQGPSLLDREVEEDRGLLDRVVEEGRVLLALVGVVVPRLRLVEAELVRSVLPVQGAHFPRKMVVAGLPMLQQLTCLPSAVAWPLLSDAWLLLSDAWLPALPLSSFAGFPVFFV